MQSHPFWAKKRFGTKSAFLVLNLENSPKCKTWARDALLDPNAKERESGQKVNDGLSVPEGEPGFPNSGPERIHGRGKQNM